MRRFVFQLCAVLCSVLGLLLLGAAVVFILWSGEILFVSVVLLSILILFLLIGYLVIRHFARPLEESMVTIKQFIGGNFKVRTYRHEPESAGLLNRHLNDLGVSLQKTEQIGRAHV